MNKKDYNEKCRVSIQEHKIDFDMLIQSYANLNKQVGKYAYLKKCSLSRKTQKIDTQNAKIPFETP